MALIFDLLKSLHKVPGILKPDQIVDPVLKGLDIVNDNITAVSNKVTNVDTKVTALKASTDACCVTTQANINASKDAILAKIDTISTGGGGTVFDPSVILTPLAAHDANLIASKNAILLAIANIVLPDPVLPIIDFKVESSLSGYLNGQFVSPATEYDLVPVDFQIVSHNETFTLNFKTKDASNINTLLNINSVNGYNDSQFFSLPNEGDYYVYQVIVNFDTATAMFLEYKGKVIYTCIAS